MRRMYPRGLVWEQPTREKVVYLTFDDGPHPEATPYVLDVLQEFEAKATFFCVGKNVQEHPDIYRRILLEGHRTGNHTHHHLNGWKTDDHTWLGDVQEAARWIDSDLFRPPYGRITPFQAKLLQEGERPFRIIMWSLLSADFDARVPAEKSLHYLKKHSRSGSVIVFHDSKKTYPKIVKILKPALEELKRKGFVFKTIE